MRKIILASLVMVWAASAHAQGWIVPRPCSPGAPCGPSVSLVERVSSVVRAELVGNVVRYEVTEQFVNYGAGLAEADYMFPLPEGAAFQGLRLSVNGEMISGESMDATRARQIYEDIVRRQRDPALVEWMGYGLLRARIFPLAHGERKTIVVRYQAVARREGDALRVEYTRGSDPRPTGGVVPMWSDQVIHQNVPARNDAASDAPEQGFVLRIPNDANYGAPFSPTHHVDVRDIGGGREVTLRGDESHVTVFVPLRHRGNAMGITVVPYSPRGTDGFMMITVTPPATAVRVTPRDVTVVIDVSGSMSGHKIEQARAAARDVLATLRPTDRFRLIDFSTDVRTFRDAYVEATPEMIAQARRYIDALDADGGTNIDGALAEALRPDVVPGRLPLVLFITDGEPTVGVSDPTSIMEHVTRWRGTRRIFTFGLGEDVNASLLEQLALDGRGTAQFVRPEESVERTVSLVASRLAAPVLTDVRVSVPGMTLTQWAPPVPPDVFAGQDLVLFARYQGHGDGRVLVEGNSPAGGVRMEGLVGLPASTEDNAFVARLWAARRIGYLDAEKRKHPGSTEFDAEIKTLGDTYGIPTEFSSYLVQEPSRDVRSQDRANLNMSLRGAPPSSSAPAMPQLQALQSRRQTFEAAKASAGQRSAMTLSDVVTTSVGGARAIDASRVTTRQVGGRTFVLRDSVWTDTRPQGKLPIMHVAPYSDAYFALLSAIPELSAPFALGGKVVVVGHGLVIAVTAQGATRLSAAQIATAQRQWGSSD